MSTDTMGWVGKKLQNADGRTGVVRREYIGFGHCSLSVRVDDGSDAHVQINTDGTYSGEKGWSWWCDNFDPALGGARWIAFADDREAVNSAVGAKAAARSA